MNSVGIMRMSQEGGRFTSILSTYPCFGLLVIPGWTPARADAGYD